MRPAPFDYYRAESVEDALRVLDEHGSHAKILAGGQSLVPLLNLRLSRPGLVIDVNRVGLQNIDVQDGALRLGALVRHCALEEHPQVKRSAPLIAAAAPLIGYRSIRTRGTIGGSLAHADPAAELATAVLALDGAVHLASSSGTRIVYARDFFIAPFMTAIRDNEMIVAVEVPVYGECGCAYEEVAIRANDFVGVAAVIRVDAGGVIDSARIAIGGVAGTPVRAHASEEAIAGRRLDKAALRDAGEAVLTAINSSNDVHSSREYRRRLSTVLTRRALATAARSEYSS